MGRRREGWWRAARSADDRGDTAVEAAILVPVVLLVGLLLVFGGRIAQARGSVASAANEAARAASISRGTSSARESAITTATTTLVNSDVTCSSTNVIPDLRGLSAPLGQLATVTVRVECTVPLSDLGLPGAPGSIEISATGESAIDVYRDRE